MGKTNNDAKKKEKASTSPPTSPKKWKANWSPGSRILSTDVRGKVREQNLDLVQTQVEGVYIGFCSKSWTNGESSYIFPMEKGLNDKEAGVNLSKEWRYVFGFLPRRDLSINDGITAMKAKRGSKWVCKVAVVVINDDSSVDKVGRHIANCFSNFTKNKDIMDTPEKYTYRRCNNNDPRALNHYLLDMDVAKILKSLGGYATKEELIQDEEVLSAFYGTSEYGKFYLEDMEEENWDNLLDNNVDGH